MKANYEKLKEFLESGVDVQALTFNQLEKITEAPISQDYLNRKTFKWSNSRFFIAARDAGFILDVVDYIQQYIIFRRTTPVLSALTVPVVAPVAAPTAGIVHPLSTRPIAAELRVYRGVTLNPTNGLVDITKANANIVEPLIPAGLRQTGTGRLLAKRYPPRAETLFIRIKDRSGGTFPFRVRNDVRDVVTQIDKDNGTNDAKYHDSQAIDLITNFIIDPTNDFERKMSSAATAPALVDEIRDLIDRAGFIDRRGKPYRPRSLPSKVCKYFSEYEYGKPRDAFYIDDAVVRECIRIYMKEFFNIRLTKARIDSSSYSDLFGWLSQINTLDTDVLKSELDHLLWYPHKKK